jgi:hypothetical protein
MATTNVIDYTTTAGQKLWNNATDKLSMELFDCESEGLRDFLELIRARSEVMGWSLSVLSIPVDKFRMNTHYGRYGAAYNMVGLHCFNEELSLLPKNPTEAKLQATSTRGESTEPT